MNKKILNTAKISARLILGAIFLFFGVGGLFQLFPTPENLPLSVILFQEGLKATKYFLPLTQSVEK